MRRSLCIATYVATLSLALVASPAWAQHRGGGSSGGHFASSSSAGHSSVGHSPAAFHSSGFSRSSGVRIRTGNPSFRRRIFVGSRFYYPYGSYYPYYGWYSDPLGYQNDDQSSDLYADANNPGPSSDDSGLRSDVQELNGKIDRLQADVEARNRPKAEEEPATALVFRDQHVEEVHNYAISGGMVWVLADQSTKKIPLAQLDLPATVKMNDDRGVDFQMPEPELSIMIVR
jgi:hypothetical protein